MKILFILFLSACIVRAQDQLVSVYNSSHEMFGGMEQGGISRSESYAFVATETIRLTEIYFNQKKLTLQKGDTLVVSSYSYTPYYDDNALPYEDEKKPEKQEELPAKLRYKVTQVSHTYYAQIQFPSQWTGTVQYTCHKENYCAKAKPGFDSTIQDYAP